MPVREERATTGGMMMDSSEENIVLCCGCQVVGFDKDCDYDVVDMAVVGCFLPVVAC